MNTETESAMPYGQLLGDQGKLRDLVARASTWTERLADEDSWQFVIGDEHLVNTRLERWCDRSSQGSKKAFERRLAFGGLDYEAAKRAVSPVQRCEGVPLPQWAILLDKALTLLEGSCTMEEMRDPNGIRYLEEIWSSFVTVARQSLQVRAGEKVSLLSKDAHSTLEQGLYSGLSSIAEPTLELEFKIYSAQTRSAAQNMVEKVLGTPSSVRGPFLDALKRGKLSEICLEYPMLARLLATYVLSWIETVNEFLTRLEEDRTSIQDVFGGGRDSGQVAWVEPFLSDRHHGGRSVSTICFTSGLKVVYKPRDLGIEQAYCDLLGWLNQHGIPLDLVACKVVNRGTHGWAEFVTAHSCESEEELHAYFFRCGMLLCICYLMGSVDLHHENLIRAGEHPIPIDLETLMHPDSWAYASEPDALTQRRLAHSVVRTGLLPRWQPAGRRYLEDSGFAGCAVSSFPNLGQSPDQGMPLSQKHARPDLYHTEVVNGFRATYEWILENRDLLSAEDGPLAAFSSQRLRFVFRATEVYSILLQSLTRSDILRDGADFSIELEVLFRLAIPHDVRPSFWAILEEERGALLQWDIPRFVTSSDSIQLQLSGDINLDDFLVKPAFASLMDKLAGMSRDDLEEQVNLITGALFWDRVKRVEHAISLPVAVTPSTSATLIEEALQIGEELAKRVITSGGETFWIVPYHDVEGHIAQPGRLGQSLFDGTSGVALFLASLARVTGLSRFDSLTRAVLTPFLENRKSCVRSEACIGGGIGYGSVVYALARISMLLESDQILEQALRVATSIEDETIRGDRHYDVVLGAAGAILGLLTLYEISPQPWIMDRARMCGDHLLARRTPSAIGCRAWATINERLQTGFSHGAAGIAYALTRLFKSTGMRIYLDAAQEAVSYETSVYVPDQGNWHDLRGTGLEAVYGEAWCNGAPGIGLARLGMLGMLDSPQVRADIAVALETTAAIPRSETDQLCCGNLGRIEFLHTAGLQLSRPDLVEAARERISEVVVSARKRNSYGYGSLPAFIPGLFQGAAGIGYELLRIARADLVPSILLWEGSASKGRGM